MIIAIVGRKTGTNDTAHTYLGSIITQAVSTLAAAEHTVLIEMDTFETFFQNETNCLIDNSRVSVNRFFDIAQEANIVIVFGGDGTMVNTAKELLGGMNHAFSVDQSPPMLGINLGRLGFITDVPFDFPLSNLLKILEGELYDIEKRSLLYSSGSLALNDVVISRSTGKILEFQVFLDDEYAYQCRGDGLIITTPTGSTAYAASAGGSIIHPTSKVLELVPMFPQTLSCRPLIINDTTKISFKLIHGAADVFCDGNFTRSLNPEESLLEIKKSTREVLFIHPRSPELYYSYYYTLREKLNWQHLPGTARS